MITESKKGSEHFKVRTLRKIVGRDKQEKRVCRDKLFFIFGEFKNDISNMNLFLLCLKATRSQVMSFL